MLDQGRSLFPAQTVFLLCQSCGYPLSIFFIVVNEFCERFSYYGMRGNPFWHPSPPFPPPPTPPPRPRSVRSQFLPLPLLTSLPSPPPLPSAKSTPDPVLPTFPGLERQLGTAILSRVHYACATWPILGALIMTPGWGSSSESWQLSCCKHANK